MKLIATTLRTYRFFPAIWCFLMVVPASSQTYSWVKQYSGASRIFGREMACAPSGDNYATAQFQGTVTLGGSAFDEATSGQLLIKHDGAGSVRWALPMKNVGINALKATADHVYLAGVYNGSVSYVATHQFGNAGPDQDAFIVRITENGVVDLVVNLTGNDVFLSEYIADMDVDAMGRMYITGGAGANAVLAGDTMSNTGRPMFFARIEQDGTVGWVTTCDGRLGTSVSTSQDASKIFVTARVEDGAVVDFDNSTVTYSHTSDGNPYGGYFMLSADNNGVVLKTRMLMSSSFRVGAPMLAVSEYNDVYLAMNHQYERSQIMKFDTLLQPVWEFYDADRETGINNIAVDVSGNLLVAGAVQGEATFSGTELSGEGNWMGFVAKYDSHGDLVWLTGAINNSDDDGAYYWGIDSDSHTDVYVNGGFSVPVVLPGYGTLTPAQHGIQDMLIARIKGLAGYNAITEHSRGGMLIYPTVNAGHFSIRLDKKVSGRCTVSDISGRCVFNTAIEESTLDIDCRLSDGIYLVRIDHDDGRSSGGKIIIRN